MLLQQEQVQNRFSILDILILYLLVFMVGSILFYSFRISTGAELPVVDMILFAFSFFDDIRFCVFAANIVFVYPDFEPDGQLAFSHLVPDKVCQICGRILPQVRRPAVLCGSAHDLWVGRRAGAAVQSPASQRRVPDRQGDALTCHPAGLQYASLARLWSRSTRLLRRAPAASSDARDGL